MIDYQFKEELIKTRERVEDLYSFEGFKASKFDQITTSISNDGPEGMVTV